MPLFRYRQSVSPRPSVMCASSVTQFDMTRWLAMSADVTGCRGYSYRPCPPTLFQAGGGHDNAPESVKNR
jgi:hypothetical protein